MQIEKLQIELRPRSPAQALDLGFALLRTRPYHAFMAYGVLMLPFLVIAAVLVLLFPEHASWFFAIPWWFKPAVERGTLYILSRQVFATNVSWQEAVRAWPGQLKGGMFALLTWFRIFSAGRCLFQPVWQLENARGSVARERRRTLGANGTAISAFWFGVVCLMLETILGLGLMYFVSSLFTSSPDTNPFAGLSTAFEDPESVLTHMLDLLLTFIVMLLFGPIYTACGFALYLNRRASLEAWDLEIKLRQIVRPAAARPTGTASLSILAGALLCCLGAGITPDAIAAPALTREQCQQSQHFERLPATTAEQVRVRRQVDRLYANDALRTSDCVERWKYVGKKKDKKKDLPKPVFPKLGWLAVLLKIVVIAALIGGVAWLLYRYRDHFPAFQRQRSVPLATEIGGLDIRAESLPPAVADEVMRLWNAGQHRAALALLYRATLSRLVSDAGVLLRQGDTEGDCVRLARRACDAERLSQERLDVVTSATALWLDAAYGGRWPQTEQVSTSCAQWDRAFPRTEAAAR